MGDKNKNKEKKKSKKFFRMIHACKKFLYCEIYI